MTQHTLQLKAVLDSSEVKAELAKLQQSANQNASSNGLNADTFYRLEVAFNKLESSLSKLQGQLAQLNHQISVPRSQNYKICRNDGNSTYLPPIITGGRSNTTVALEETQTKYKTVVKDQFPDLRKLSKKPSFAYYYEQLASIGNAYNGNFNSPTAIYSNSLIDVNSLFINLARDVYRTNLPTKRQIESLQNASRQILSANFTQYTPIDEVQNFLDANPAQKTKQAIIDKDVLSKRQELINKVNDQLKDNTAQQQRIVRASLAFIGGSMIAGELQKNDNELVSGIGNTLHGATTGAMAGMAFGPQGIAIGAAIGGITQATHAIAKALIESAEKIRDAGIHSWHTYKTAKYDVKEVEKNIADAEFTKALNRMSTENLNSEFTEAQEAYDALVEEYKEFAKTSKEELADIDKRIAEATDSIDGDNTKEENINKLQESAKAISDEKKRLEAEMEEAAKTLQETKSVKLNADRVKAALDAYEKKLDTEKYYEDIQNLDIPDLQLQKDKIQRVLDYHKDLFKWLNAKNDKSVEDIQQLQKTQQTIEELTSKNINVGNILQQKIAAADAEKQRRQDELNAIDEAAYSSLKTIRRSEAFDSATRATDKYIYDIQNNKEMSIDQKLQAIYADYTRSDDKVKSLKRQREQSYATLFNTDDIEYKKDLQKAISDIDMQITEANSGKNAYARAMESIASASQSKFNPNLDNVTSIAQYGYGMGEKDDEIRIQMMQESLIQVKDYMLQVKDKLFEGIDVHARL